MNPSQISVIIPMEIPWKSHGNPMEISGPRREIRRQVRKIELGQADGHGDVWHMLGAPRFQDLQIAHSYIIKRGTSSCYDIIDDTS